MAKTFRHQGNRTGDSRHGNTPDIDFCINRCIKKTKNESYGFPFVFYHLRTYTILYTSQVWKSNSPLSLLGRVQRKHEDSTKLLNQQSRRWVCFLVISSHDIQVPLFTGHLLNANMFLKLNILHLKVYLSRGTGL